MVMDNNFPNNEEPKAPQILNCTYILISMFTDECEMPLPKMAQRIFRVFLDTSPECIHADKNSVAICLRSYHIFTGLMVKKGVLNLGMDGY